MAPATLYPRQSVAFPKPARVQSPEDAEKASQELRKAWELGDAPIDSLVETVEDKGGFVIEYPESGIQFDRLSGKADGRPVIVVNPGQHVDRCRYNVAHELGHVFTTCPRQLSEKEQEPIAHRFAAALLVPARVAKEELGEKRRHLDFGELGVLKQKYGLSMQAWIRRAKDLEIIPDSVYKSLCIEFSSRGWRRQEPVVYQGREKPKRLVQMVLCAPFRKELSVPMTQIAFARDAARTRLPPFAKWENLHCRRLNYCDCLEASVFRYLPTQPCEQKRNTGPTGI